MIPQTGLHGGVVVSTVASQQEGSISLKMKTFIILVFTFMKLLVCLWVNVINNLVDIAGQDGAHLIFFKYLLKGH